MILSILIPTLPERAHLLQRVYSLLGEYDPNEVEILTDPTPRGELTTGQKRNILISRANGEYVSQIDDDDFPQNGYISELLKAIKSGYPDCVTFNGYYTENSGPRINFTIKLGENYEARHGHVYRWPNHLTAIRKSIAQSVKFPNQTIGEDFIWSKEIADRRLIKTSVHIDKDLYYYDYRSNK